MRITSKFKNHNNVIVKLLIMGIKIVVGTLSALNSHANEIQLNEGYIQTSYGSIYYKKVFTNNNKDHTPLLVLHGGPGLTHDALDTIAELASELPVIFYDQTGAGKSNNFDKNQVSWDINFFLKDLENVIEYFKFDSIYLLGFSWGGTLALEYALKPENIIKKLILASPFLSTELWTQDQQTLLNELEPELKNIIFKHIKQGTTNSHDYQKAIHVFNSRHLFRLPEWTESMLFTMQNMNPEIHQTMFGTDDFITTGNMENYDRFNEVKNIKIPLLLTCGRHDQARPNTLANAIEGMTNARLCIFEESAHLPHIEEKELYLEKIINFITKKTELPNK